MTRILSYKIITRLFVLAYFAMTVLERGPAEATDPLSGATDRTTQAPAAPVRASAFPAAVLQVYRASCLQCHDSDGRGEVARDTLPKIPDFTEARWQVARSDAELSHSILEGKGKSMPRMKGKLGSVDVMQMVAFVRAFRGGAQVVEESEELPAPVQSTVAGARTGTIPRAVALASTTPKESSIRQARLSFQRMCARCHGPDGKGSEVRESLPTIPDFSVTSWQTGRTDPQLVVSVLEGKGTAMPAFRDKVTREQARDLVTFIRTFAPVPGRPAPAAADDFKIRFQQLEKEFNELRRQIPALSSPPESTPASKERPTRSAPPGSLPG
jgi:mono/diheme cytochrome c family protein